MPHTIRASDRKTHGSSSPNRIGDSVSTGIVQIRVVNDNSSSMRMTLA
jgi:hypothetical protein